MRKPSSDPTKPAKLKGKDFRVGSGRGYWEERRIDHPLLKGIYEGTMVILEARWQLEGRKNKFRSLVMRQEWEKCLEMLQPKLRLGYLLSIRRLIDEDMFFGLLRTILTQSTCLRPYRYPLSQLIRRTENRTFRTGMMSEPEITQLEILPDPVTVWRGAGEPGLGWAWTLKRAVALEYAKTYLLRTSNQQGFLLKGLVGKAHIIALFSTPKPGQETVFVDPEWVRLVQTRLVKPAVQPAPPLLLPVKPFTVHRLSKS